MLLKFKSNLSVLFRFFNRSFDSQTNFRWNQMRKRLIKILYFLNIAIALFIKITLLFQIRNEHREDGFIKELRRVNTMQYR